MLCVIESSCVFALKKSILVVEIPLMPGESLSSCMCFYSGYEFFPVGPISPGGAWEIRPMDNRFSTFDALSLFEFFIYQ